jgi:hypothetical protein
MTRTPLTEVLPLFVVSAAGIFGGLSQYLNRDARTQSSVLAPGVYILILGALLLLTALIYMSLRYRSSRGAANESSQRQTAWASPLVMKIIGAFAVYAYLIDRIGYAVPTLLFLLTEFRLLGVRSWKINIILTALVTAVFYIVFIRYCEMVFPRGTLFE